MSTDSATNWYSDAPVGIDSDKLDRGTFLDRIEAVLGSLQATNDSTVTGLVGAWGSGKTSLLNQLAKKLGSGSDASTQWTLVRFNPWYYQDLLSLQLGFFSELQAALPKKKTWNGVREKLSALAKSVAPLGALMAPLGVDLSAIIDSAAEAIDSDRSVPMRQKELSEALARTGKHVLVVVDDVDRLDPPELLLLLKLIRLTGRIPGIHYLLAYDEKTLLDVRSRTGLVGQSPRRAIDYMEKIIQVRLDLPPVRPMTMERWFNRLLSQLLAKHNTDFDEEGMSRFNNAYFTHIERRLDTPRSLKRYIAQTDTTVAGLEHEVDLSDFLIMSWIRTAEPLLFRELPRNRERLLGSSSPWLSGVFGQDDSTGGHSYWVKVMERAQVDPENRAGVAALLGQLFPRFRHDWTKETGHPQGADLPPKRVGNKDYFDRYFAFSVPEEDISDEVARAAFEQISSENPREQQWLEDQLQDRATLVLEKLDAWLNEAPSNGSLVLLWLIENHTKIPPHTDIGDASRRAVFLAGQLFAELSAQSQMEIVERVSRSEEDMLFFREVRHAASSKAEISPEVDQAYTRSIEAFLVGFDPAPTKAPIDGAWLLVMDLIRLDLPTARSWANRGLDQGLWDPIDFASGFVNTLVPLGVPNPVARIDSFNLSRLAQVVDLSRLVDGLDLTESDREIDLGYDPAATPENRLLTTRQALADFKFSEAEQDS